MPKRPFPPINPKAITQYVSVWAFQKLVEIIKKTIEQWKELTDDQKDTVRESMRFFFGRRIGMANRRDIVIEIYKMKSAVKNNDRKKLNDAVTALINIQKRLEA